MLRRNPNLSPAIHRSLARATVLLSLTWASAAPALEVALDPPRDADGYVWVDIRLSDLFSPRVEESLARGMPGTLQLHAELWRRRTAWFDRMEGSGLDASIRIRYDVWSERYRIERKGTPTRSLGSLDSVRAHLSGPLGLQLAPTASFKPASRYYVVVSVTLKPLSVEDIEEGEGWLSGEVRTKRRAGLGIITAIPHSLFDAVRNFTGFGDQRARARTEDFYPESLSAGR